MAVPKAALQPFVDWCTQPGPAPIFLKRVGAFLYVQSKDDPVAFADYYQGELAYLPAGFIGPARFHGVLRSNVNEYWTLDVKIFDFVEVSLLFPNGVISETGQIDQVPDGAPGQMKLTFRDDQAAYTLDLLDETVIDWNLIRRQHAVLVNRAGASSDLRDSSRIRVPSLRPD